MVGEAKVLEESFAQSVAEQLGTVVSTGASVPVPTYDFNEQFQRKILALMMRSTHFNRQVEGLIEPAYFDNQVYGVVANLINAHFASYKTAPDISTFVELVKRAVNEKRIRKDLVPDIKKTIVELKKESITDSEYVADVVAEFARHQALLNALVDMATHLERREFDKAVEVVRKAGEVGKHSEEQAYDYYKMIAERTERRQAVLAGKIKKDGITTGIPKLDKVLYHDGWGRKELTVFMGGPKAGKSTALADFAKNATLAGFNALYVTLEVSNEIISSRLDANLADIVISDVGLQPNAVDAKIRALESSEKVGNLIIIERPSGTMTPKDLYREISKLKAEGHTFDLIAVDYADIMAPSIRSESPTENSKSVYIELRAIASMENVAMLTATQTNREGAKSVVSKMEHVAEDFNKVRIADLLISINRSDEEKLKGIARLFMAASRNSAGDMTIFIKQDQERMKFITEMLDKTV